MEKNARVAYTYGLDEYDALCPYCFTAWDTVLLGKEHSSHRTENFWR